MLYNHMPHVETFYSFSILMSPNKTGRKLQHHRVDSCETEQHQTGDYQLGALSFAIRAIKLAATGATRLP